ncbi:10588_t:CDS:2 [Funneliformis mosseae]|uniref:10588_t:CDS:1 n=1 Tax=Funneliformis mosseae TaxID=27381 RepID=A0A9N9D544_FUNMO|nr:10588_t:CDS:2 [Funneliformis mosseae]
MAKRANPILQLTEFYSKVYVARSVIFITDKASKEEISLSKSDIFSRNLAMILARDSKVVAVNMKILPSKCRIYISKNGLMKNLSKNALMTFEQATKRKDMSTLFFNVFEYCSVKFRHRLDKLKRDIKDNNDEPHIKSFLEFLESSEINIPRTHQKSGIHSASVMDIVNCARKEKYKTSFSCIDLHLSDPISGKQTISPCKKHNEFIAVFKKCFYLCESYIKFLQSKGYKITISEGHRGHKKLYYKWKLPDAYSSEFVKNVLCDLNQIIESGIDQHTKTFAKSNNDGDSTDSDNPK